MKTKIKLLIVENIAMMRMLTKHMLLDLGYAHITEADDGVTALTMLRDKKFDIVITDLNLPGMSGLELLLAIRGDVNLTHLPIIMITAEAQKEKIIEAIASGVNGYIKKPFTAQVLALSLEKQLKTIVCPLALSDNSPA